MSFTRLESTDFVISSDAVTAPAWTANNPVLAAGGGTVDNGYYIDVYNGAPGSPGSAIQYSIAYGQAEGTGSSPLNDLVPALTPTRINYGQYRNIVYGDNEKLFNFGPGNTASLNMVAIQVDRNRYKEALFPGTFNIVVNGINLTDDSKDSTAVNYLDCGRAYNIISGSNGTKGTGGGPSPSNGYYGLFLPDVGLIVLNPDACGMSFSTSTGPGITGIPDNTTALGYIGDFTLNSFETISSDYVFVRIKNAEYNYSTNPSYMTGSGNLLYSDFINNSQTYITTVGLYNDNNELLAVAKLSKPLVKDFTKEALIRVKLDW
mgnify:CR=1 FL=1